MNQKPLNRIHFLKYFLYLLAISFSLHSVYAQPGTNNAAFNTVDPGFGIGDGADAEIICSLQQPDGKYILGGSFKKFNDRPIGGVVRINEDGSLDPTWNPGGTGATNYSLENVYCVVRQTDGKILVGGGFTKYNGVTCNRIVRLNTDGTIDPSFVTGTGLNGVPSTIIVLANGQLLVGGGFTTYNGSTQNRLMRLNTDGSIDASFDPGTGPDVDLTCVKVLSDGRLFISGAFDYYNGVYREGCAIVSANGTLDATFLPNSGVVTRIYDAVQQTDGKLIIVGDFTNYNNAVRNRIARINLDGTLDFSFNTLVGSDDVIRKIELLADGKVLLGGESSSYNNTPVSHVLRVNTDGSLDPTFNTGTGFSYPLHSEFVNHILLQADGKILVVGPFEYYNGTYYKNVVRLGPNGETDLAFNKSAGFGTGAVNTVLELPDGKLMIGGEFNRYNASQIDPLVRVNADGSPDPTFSNVSLGSLGSVKCVRQLIQQPDGKILLCGAFGVVGSRIRRLLADGTPDNSFSSNITSNDTVHAMALQPDGKIIIGGNFSAVNGTTRINIARLNADGSLDASFAVPNTGFLQTVRTVALQADGKVLVGGDFIYYGGTAINRIVRLNADGSIDLTFAVGQGCDKTVNSIVVQPDGKIVLAGNFGLYKSTLCPRIVRVLPDGTPDASFTPGAGFNKAVRSLFLRNDGKIFAVGTFTTYNGTSQNGLTCIKPDGSRYTSLDFGTGFITATDVRCVLQLSTENVFVAGDFTSYNGIGRNRSTLVFYPKNTYDTISPVVCNQFTAPSGAIFTSSGTYQDIIPNVAGTDSIITINLTVNPTINHTENITACDSYTWSDGVTYTASNNTATQTFTGQAGCDSIVTLNLVIHNSNSGIATVSSCGPYLWIDGNTYASSTSSPTYTLTNVSGCDSVVTLHLTVHSPTSGTDVQTACGSFQWIDGNTYYADNQTATFTLTNAAGCDSVVTLDLTVLQPSAATVYESSCGSYVWPVNGFTYVTSGTYSYTTTNAAGCDSVITLELTIPETTQGEEFVTACGSYTWINGTTYTSSGTGSMALMNAAGCDSIVTLHVTILPSPDVTLSDDGAGTITATGAAASYQWIDCTTQQPVSGATGSNFTPASNGSYAVITVSADNCTATSACISVAYLDLPDNVIDQVAISPNPTTDDVHIVGILQGTLTVLDAHGRTIHKGALTGASDFSLKDEQAGVYLFVIRTAEGILTKRVVKL